MMRSFLLASVAATVVLLLVNLFVFPLVFGSGMPVPYANLRAEPQLALHAVALLVTGGLLSAICGRGPAGIGPASVTGALCGLLASLPSGLHTLAMVDLAATAQIAPILWTTVTWGLAGSTAGAVYGRQAAISA